MQQKAVKTSCEICETGPKTYTIAVRGELGLSLGDCLFGALSGVGSHSGVSAALDFSEGSGLDGEGLLSLFRVGYLAKQNSVSLSALGTGRESREILTRLGLASVISLLPPDEGNTLHEICRKEEWSDRFHPVRREELPPGDRGLNVLGREIQCADKGYGRLWLKRYLLPLCETGLTTAEIVSVLRSRVSEFWPDGNEIGFGEKGIIPGAVGMIRLTMPGGAPLVTGVRVVHAGPSSFTFAPIAGHMAAGFINFSGAGGDGRPAVKITSLARTGDPFFDVGFRLFGHRQQEEFWRETLTRAANALGVPAAVASSKEIVDGSTIPAGWGNLFNNAAIITPFGLFFDFAGSLFHGRRG